MPAMQILRRTDGAVLFSGTFATVKAMLSAAAGSNLAYAQLSPVWFVRAGYGDASCIGVNISNTDFTGANLRGLKLEVANLNGSNFTGALMRGVVLGLGIDVDGRDVVRVPNDHYPTPPAATVAGANFTNAELAGAHLDRVDLSTSTLTGARLNGALLSQANLTGRNLAGLRMRRVKLYGANLTNADLDGSDLRDANLLGATLTGASLVATDLRGANLTGVIGADLSQAIIDGRYYPDELPIYDYDTAPAAPPLPYDHE